MPSLYDVSSIFTELYGTVPEGNSKIFQYKVFPKPGRRFYKVSGWGATTGKTGNRKISQEYYWINWISAFSFKDWSLESKDKNSEAVYIVLRLFLTMFSL